MSEHLEDLFARLERERQAADRLYNDALTALDAAIQWVPGLPAGPTPFDGSLLPRLNDRWNILPTGEPPADRSLRGRLRSFIWRLVGPPLDAQRQFNATLVDHLNRNAGGEQSLPEALESLRTTFVRELEALVRFESLLVQYLQTITLYVDTKVRRLGASELSQRVTLGEQRLLALRREVERLLGGRPSLEGGGGTESLKGRVDSVTYVGFEDRFRGPRSEVQRRVEEYVAILESASEVVDVGCGRGELLAMLRARGVEARGVDGNHAMVELCRAQGLNVELGDALAYLRSQRDESIGGLVAIQAVEHFEPVYLTRFLEAAYQKMRPGAPLILETINPACWMAFFECYIRDLTHQRPLHPETLQYLVQAAGFTGVDLRFRQPVPDADRLGHVPAPAGAENPALVSLAATLNAHADKLNARLFSAMDYFVIARR